MSDFSAADDKAISRIDALAVSLEGDEARQISDGSRAAARHSGMAAAALRQALTIIEDERAQA